MDRHHFPLTALLRRKSHRIGGEEYFDRRTLGHEGIRFAVIEGMRNHPDAVAPVKAASDMASEESLAHVNSVNPLKQPTKMMKWRDCKRRSARLMRPAESEGYDR